MPELPEVETTRLGLERIIIDFKIEKVIIKQAKLRFLIPNQLIDLLPKTTVIAVKRIAKYLLVEFSHGSLLIHLGMSGSISVVKQSEPMQKHEHFVLNFSNGHSMRLKDPRRFGAILWQDRDKIHPLLANLGVEPLSDEFNVNYLYHAIQGKKRSIKSLIMDSKIVVGVGNIYALEALFMANISPFTTVDLLNQRQISSLVKVIKTVLSKAIKQGGTTLKDFSGVDKQAGYFAQELLVYGRANKPCLTCSDIIIRIKQNQRSSYYCPTCQS